MPPPVVKDEEPRNWSELPPELTSSIMLRLDVVDILEKAQMVCRAWRCVTKDPSMWRKIDMRGIFGYYGGMCRIAVDRSEGGLVEINLSDSGSDFLLNYIADRSSNLKSLGMELGDQVTKDGLVNAVTKIPLLEELEVSNVYSKLDLKAIGNSCPKLKTLKLHCHSVRLSLFRCDDDDALAIAETMPELRHLQLIANRLTNTGLKGILDNCLHLEHLDIRCCLNINLSADLEKRCLERVKEFRRPYDSTADYPYFIHFYNSDDDSDYYYGPYGGDGTEIEKDLFSGV